MWFRCIISVENLFKYESLQSSIPEISFLLFIQLNYYPEQQISLLHRAQNGTHSCHGLHFKAYEFKQVLALVKTLAIASLAVVAVANPFEFVVYQDGACNGPVADQRIDRPIGSCTSKIPSLIS